jgi:meiotically up-regulated gene 157 (Mug157) protein
MPVTIFVLIFVLILLSRRFLAHALTLRPIAYPSNRPPLSKRTFNSTAVEAKIVEIKGKIKDEKLAWMFENCFPNTLDTTVKYFGQGPDGVDDTFIITGDINAMWLRDSAAQVYPYVSLAKDDAHLQRMISGVLHRQFRYIIVDPYANAFNQYAAPGQSGTASGLVGSYVFERKYELDSLCYPIRLGYHYWKTTGDNSTFGTTWVQAVSVIVRTCKEQQKKNGWGPYLFIRSATSPFETLGNGGRGNPLKPVGLIASAFRPSDDATIFQYLIPANFMAVSSLRKAAEILTTVNKETALATECADLAAEVEAALKEYAHANHPTHGHIYAYEVDGLGNQHLTDDSNVPSLLGMAYLGDVPQDDPVYQNTRKFVLSLENGYFFKGRAGEGIGGPHCGFDMIWPMSIIMRAFTSQSETEIAECVRMLRDTDNGTGFIHESFHKDNPARFTRKWFAWANTLFGELLIWIIECHPNIHM